MTKTYPKDYRGNLAWRRKMLLKAKLDPGYKEKLRLLFFEDPIFAFNGFFMTLDVRRRPYHHQPFCTYPFQDEVILELVRSINEGQDIVLEKSRDMGVSWMVILVFEWFWLNPMGGADFLLGSRIEDYVDKKGDMRTLMEKARYAIYRLPRWLLPKGFRRKVHDNFMRLVNPETGSSLTGESNNANFSTGGRYAGVLFDEFAKWESTDKSAWTAAGDATPSRIAVSTPFGAAGQYYDLVTDGRTHKVHLHWSLHPVKASDAYCEWPRTDEDTLEEERLVRSGWYDRECARRRPLEVAQELDIDYIGAGNPVFDGKAGKRIALLLRVTPPTTSWYALELDSLKAVQCAAPRDGEGFLGVFSPPDPTKLYCIAVDVVEGVEEGDFAVLKVYDRTTKSVSASYYSRIDEVQLAKIVKISSDMFSVREPPWVGIETNGPGLATFDLAWEIHHVRNLFMMPRYDAATDKMSYKKGWRTDTISRNRLISGIREWLLAGEGWTDQRSVREMTTFVRDKRGKAAAKPGTNDDEVIALGIAIQVDELAPFEEFKGEEARREDGLPDRVFGELVFKDVDEPTTIEERCLASVLAKKEFQGDDESWDGPFDGQIEGYFPISELMEGEL